MRAVVHDRFARLPAENGKTLGVLTLVAQPLLVVGVASNSRSRQGDLNPNDDGGLELLPFAIAETHDELATLVPLWLR